MPQPGATARLVRNESWAKLHTDDPGVVDAVYRLLRFRPAGYAFMPRFKRGAWDGWMSLFKRRAGTFPGGLTERVVDRLQELDVAVTFEDRCRPPAVEPQLVGGVNNITLRPYQVDACDKAVAARRGVIDAATGTGKTEILGEVIRRLACRTLIIVASRDLAHQTICRFQGTETEPGRLTFPNADPERLYGIVGDDIDAPGLITAALYQTLVRRLMPVCAHCGAAGELDRQTCDAKKGDRRCGGALDFAQTDTTLEWLASFDALFLDECHRSVAKTWTPVVTSCPAYFRYGLSATPFKSDPITELKLVGATGEVFYSFPAKDAVEAGVLATPLVTMVTPSFPVTEDEDVGYMDSYRDDLVDHEKRNRLIADIAYGTSQGWGVPTLILVLWREQGRNIRRSLWQLGLKVDFIDGTASTDRRKEAMDELVDGPTKCLISSSILDEGVDIPGIGALILAGGGRAGHKVIQRVGRGLRVVEGKEYLAVFDFGDEHAPKYLAGHGRKRLRAAKDAGFDWQKLTSEETLARIAAGDMRCV